MRARFWIALALGLGACGVPAPPDVPALGARAKDGNARAVSELVSLLGADQNPEMRGAAYQTLVEVGGKHGDKILSACRDADVIRREHALALSGNLKLPGAHDEAVRALADKGFPRRYVAAWTLGQLAEARGVGPLLAAFSSDEGEVLRAAARALIKVGEPAVGPLVAALPSLKGESRGAALRVLGDLRDPRALGPLVSALAEPEIRADAAWALGTLSHPEAAKPLLPLLGDGDWRVRLEACRALGLLEVKEADGPLDRLRRSDPVPAVREWAARGLGLLRGAPQDYRDAQGAAVQPENLYR